MAVSLANASKPFAKLTVTIAENSTIDETEEVHRSMAPDLDLANCSSVS